MHIIQTISKILASVQTKIAHTPKQQLGRWTVEYCDRMTRKLDWANHDHCGPCNIPKVASPLRAEDLKYK